MYTWYQVPGIYYIYLIYLVYDIGILQQNKNAWSATTAHSLLSSDMFAVQNQLSGLHPPTFLGTSHLGSFLSETLLSKFFQRVELIGDMYQYTEA